MQHVFHVVDLVAQEEELAGQILNLQFRAAIDVVVQLTAQAVLRVLPVLAHHNYRRLNRGQHREKQIEQDERIRVPRPGAEVDVDEGVDDQDDAERNDE